MIAIDLSKQEALDPDPKAIQQINFAANLDRTGNKRFYFILEEANETVFEFSQVTVKVLRIQISWRSLIFIDIKITQYNSLNVRLSNSHLNKLKTEIKNETEVVLRLSSNMIGGNWNNFSQKLQLTNRQVANHRKALANHLSTDIKLSKTQLSKMIQSGGFLGRLLGPLLKTALLLICD